MTIIQCTYLNEMISYVLLDKSRSVLCDFKYIIEPNIKYIL